MAFSLNDLARIGKEIDGINEAAFFLWDWLPSQDEAVKHHGDYACEKQPDPENVMKEACHFFALLKYPNSMTVDEAIEWFSCPCREHDLTREEAEALLERLRTGK